MPPTGELNLSLFNQEAQVVEEAKDGESMVARPMVVSEVFPAGP